MTNDDIIKRPLSYKHVDAMLEKLALTFEKYELIIPDISELQAEIVKTKPKDDFERVMIIIEKLKKYETRSPLMRELADNVAQDFYHGVNEEIPPHKGEFYINSSAD